MWTLERKLEWDRADICRRSRILLLQEANAGARESPPIGFL